MRKSQCKPANTKQQKLKKTSNERERETKGAQKPVQPKPLLFSNPKFIYCAVIIAVIITLSHWPALSAKALSVDDQQYLTGNVLVQYPGWPTMSLFLT